MSEPKKICVVTGSRAEYGLLRPVMELLQGASLFELQVVCTGMHLSPQYGETWKCLVEDGFEISAKVESLVAGDTASSVTKSIGLGIIGFADAFAHLQPRWVLMLGDRYEIFAAAQAALIAGIPIAHLAGGDTTEGAFDESIRHSISKMAHVHFATNELSARRLRQMGEAPETVHVVGSTGVDTIRQVNLLTREQLEEQLAIRFQPRNITVTYHPSTLDHADTAEGLEALLGALDELGSDVGIFITKSNSDPGGEAISRRLESWVAGRSQAAIFTSLGSQRYLSLVRQSDVVLGNSSSGLMEAPALGVPTVNIGNRQRGRLAGNSVYHCPARKEDILSSLEQALAMSRSDIENPYGDGTAASQIVRILCSIEEPRALLKKSFHLLDHAA